MIDTIVLSLTPDTYQISEPDKFKPNAHWALQASKSKEARLQYRSITSKQNTTKKELLKGIYKPHLTLAYHRGIQGIIEPLLKIELSLPKLLYGNNFNELQYKDFKTITHKLTITLATMGVVVAAETLTHAPVVAIHYSKNIPLTDGSTPYHYINKIKEANVHLSLDTNQTDYRNEGHSYNMMLLGFKKALEAGHYGNLKQSLAKISHNHGIVLLLMQTRLHCLPCIVHSK